MAENEEVHQKAEWFGPLSLTLESVAVRDGNRCQKLLLSSLKS